jgi:hypothetical protein
MVVDALQTAAMLLLRRGSEQRKLHDVFSTIENSPVCTAMKLLCSCLLLKVAPLAAPSKLHIYTKMTTKNIQEDINLSLEEFKALHRVFFNSTKILRQKLFKASITASSFNGKNLL